MVGSTWWSLLCGPLDGVHLMWSSWWGLLCGPLIGSTWWGPLDGVYLMGSAVWSTDGVHLMGCTRQMLLLNTIILGFQNEQICFNLLLYIMMFANFTNKVFHSIFGRSLEFVHTLMLVISSEPVQNETCYLLNQFTNLKKKTVHNSGVKCRISAQN